MWSSVVLACQYCIRSESACLQTMGLPSDTQQGQLQSMLVFMPMCKRTKRGPLLAYCPMTLSTGLWQAAQWHIARVLRSCPQSWLRFAGAFSSVQYARPADCYAQEYLQMARSVYGLHPNLQMKLSLPTLRM